MLTSPHSRHQMPTTIVEEGAPIVTSLAIQEDAVPHDHQIVTREVVVVDEHLLDHLNAILEVGGAFPGHLTGYQGDVHSQGHLIDILGHLIGILGDAPRLGHLTTTTIADGLHLGHRAVFPGDELLHDRLITT